MRLNLNGEQPIAKKLERSRTSVLDSAHRQSKTSAFASGRETSPISGHRQHLVPPSKFFLFDSQLRLLHLSHNLYIPTHDRPDQLTERQDLQDTSQRQRPGPVVIPISRLVNAHGVRYFTGIRRNALWSFYQMTLSQPLIN